MSLQKQYVSWDQYEVVEGEPVYFNIWAKSCVNKTLICVQQLTCGIYRTAQSIIYNQILIIIKWMKLMLFCHMYRMSKRTHLYCMPWRCRYLKEKFWLTFPRATMISSKSRIQEHLNYTLVRFTHYSNMNHIITHFYRQVNVICKRIMEY